MSDINECGCTMDQPEVTPIGAAVNIAPAPEYGPQQAALLSTKPIVPSVQPININVWIKDTEAPFISQEEDTVEFVVNFTVSHYDESTGASKQFVVPKKIAVSKRRLFADGEQGYAAIATAVVESKDTKKKTDAQRFRELAGIPHSKNHLS